MDEKQVANALMGLMIANMLVGGGEYSSQKREEFDDDEAEFLQDLIMEQQEQA